MQKALASLLGVGFFLAYVLKRAGAFYSIKFLLKSLPQGKKMLLKGYRGEYREVKKFLDKIPSDNRVVAVYWDDPNIVEEKSFRFSVGVIQGENPALDEQLKLQKYLETEVEHDLEAIYCEFPYTGTLSFIIGAFRVFPKWVEEAKRLNKGHGPIFQILSKKEEKADFFFLTFPPTSKKLILSMENINNKI